MIYRPKKKRGYGRTADKVLCRLIDLLGKDYPGIGISPDDFWLQKGDYIKATWDTARWGAKIPYTLESGGRCHVDVYSFDTMTSCAKGMTMFKPRGGMLHEYEIVADVI